MKKEWTEQDLREFVRSAQAAFEDVTLTEADEEAARSWQDDGLMVDYELRNGQVDCVLRRQIVADGKVWKLQMTAPLAGNDLPEDRMSPREREMCRDDMNHDFLSGVFNRRYFETEFCTRLDDWTDAHRCASLALVELDRVEQMQAEQGDAVMDQLVCFVANQWKKHYDRPDAGGLPPDRYAVRHWLCGQDLRRTGRGTAEHLRGDASCLCGFGGPDAPGAVHPVHRLRLHLRGAGQELGRTVRALCSTAQGRAGSWRQPGLRRIRSLDKRSPFWTS